MAALNFRRRVRRRVPVVHQMEVAECGAACLAMVLGFHGRHVPLAQLREACAVTRDGANAYNLLNAARQNGLDARALQIQQPAELQRLALPAILHWDFNHFVVLEKCSRETLSIVDPNGGRQTISMQEAGRRFTGIVLCFQPASGFQPRPASRPSLVRYRALLASLLPNLGQILLATLALQLLGLVAPVGSLLLLDRVITPRQLPWLWGLGIALGATVVARAMMTLVRSWVLQGLQNALDASLMGRFLDHLLHLPLAFFLQREAGDLVQRVQSNAMLRQLFSSQSLSALLDSVLLLGYALLMLAFHWPLGLIVFAFGIARVLLFLGLRKRSQRIMASELAGSGRENAALVAALTGLETTRAIGGEDRMVARWVQPMAATLNRQIERRRLEINVDQLATLLKALALAAVFIVGGHAVVDRQITLGVFAAFLTLQSLFMQPLESLMQAAAQLQYLSSHLHRLDDVMEAPMEASGREQPRLTGEIELEAVNFGYSAQAPMLLRAVSLKIAKGEKIAIVGRSGAGKSTLARLLLGMHLPDAGTIRFDGRDMRACDLSHLRRQMGVVQQETFLFDDTIRANLSLNDPDLPLERLRWAADLACIDDVIEALPQGYRSRAGENGCLLSGGQRQRLAIARAVAHSPAILLLDEATSSLDLDTESRIHANLGQLGCTRIVIAHRLATVMDADRILVLENGCLVQQGRYHALLDQHGLFRDMADSFESMAEAQHA
jgi:ABC-type bacteriocin/lantibiotic exporter with double-glycine peptidase domain